MIMLKPPKIMMVNADSGTVCQITYNGQVWEHSQMWQVMVYYHQLMASYQHDVNSAEALQLSQDSILDAASTSSIIPNSLCCDYAPSSMEPN